MGSQGLVCVCDRVCDCVCVFLSCLPVCPPVTTVYLPCARAPHRHPASLQEQKFCQRYDQLMEAWEKKVERIENNPRRRAKESKVREYYEKQFPEIRKQRELQERMQR